MLNIDTQWIPVTEDYKEIVSIGRQIEEKNPQIYTPQMVERIKKSIVDYCSDRTPEQQLALFYHSLYDYWMYGATIDEEIYLKLENKTDTEKKSYITERNRWQYYRFLNTGDWHLLRNKYQSYLMLKEHYKRDMIEVKGDENKAEFNQFVDRHPIFVVKPVGGSCAYGVSKISADDYRNRDELFDALLVILEDTKHLSNLEQVKSLVLEELIEQVDELAVFHPSSVNAIRLITVRTGQDVAFFYPWIKFGAHGSFVASAAVHGFDAGIDPQTGVIITDGFTESGESVECHPDSGIRFKGYQIPRWKELLVFGRQLALSLPSFRYVGWDVVLTPKGWCLMEANHAGQFMGQMIFQRGLRKEFEELIGWPNNEKAENNQDAI